MGLHLRRRRAPEPSRPPATPPADGAAPCVDAYSRRWAREPVAGRFVDWTSAAHHAGFGRGFVGVWLERIPPLARRRLTGPRLSGRADEVLLLLAEERVTDDGFHVHAGVGDSVWFGHAFGVGPIPELPATEPGSATLQDALERAADDWGPVTWTAVPAQVPRGLLDTLAWALEPRIAAAS